MSLNFLYSGVSWVLLRWHQFLTLLGLSAGSGLTWALSIIFLVVTVRALLFPLVLKQLHHQRRMQTLQPRLQQIKTKFPGDRQAQQRAVLELQQEEGLNPLAGCLPMLLQIPIFIALLHVLRHVSNAAAWCHPAQLHAAKLALYTFTSAQTCSAADAKLFGAPLAATLTDSRHLTETTLGGSHPATLIATIVVVIISAVAALCTQRLARTGSSSTPEGTAATVQRLIGLVIPVSVLISGVFFPLGLLIYWLTGNVATLGQQLYVNRFHPHLRSPDPAPPPRPT